MKRQFFDDEIRRRKLTYTAVGKAVNVSRPMISQLVHGKVNPSWKLQQRLAQYFNIPIEKLLALTAHNEETTQ